MCLALAPQAQLNMDAAPETAQYSCHVVGLVMDASRRTLFVADPNGASLPGGNIELLAVPSYVLGADPSTSRSRFDIDADPNFPAAPSSARSTISNATASPCAGSVSDLEFLEPPTPRALQFSQSATQSPSPQGVVERANRTFEGKLSKWMRDQRTKT